MARMLLQRLLQLVVEVEVGVEAPMQAWMQLQVLMTLQLQGCVRTKNPCTHERLP